MKEPLDKRGLGRGLDALFQSVSNNNENNIEQNAVVQSLALSSICPANNQPRQYFAEAALEELAQSIKEQGILQPILVRPKANSTPFVYEIIAGERRWRAAKKIGLTEVPVIIKELSDLDAKTIAIIENLQRENLNALEEALAYKELKELYNLSQEEVAQKIGKSRAHVANAIRLLKLPSEVQSHLQANKISAGHARALLSFDNDALACSLLPVILQKQISVRELEEIADYYKKNNELPANAILENTNINSQEMQEKPTSKTQKRPTKSDEIKKLQKTLREKIAPKLTISGDTTRGRISIPYTDETSLNNILAKLGILI